MRLSRYAERARFYSEYIGESLVRLLFVGMLSFLLAGCQTPIVHGVNQIINLGQELPENMRQRNIAGVVAFDEAWAGD